MSWFRVDDKAAFHRKVLRAGNEAFGALCRAGAVSASEGTDGRLTAETCEAIAPGRVWEKLIAAGLAERVDDSTDIQIHDYLQWNPSAAEVEEAREAKRRAGAKGGKIKALGRSTSLAPATASATVQASRELASARAAAVADALVNSSNIPSHPIPSLEDQDQHSLAVGPVGTGPDNVVDLATSKAKPSKAQRGTRCPSSDAPDVDVWLVAQKLPALDSAWGADVARFLDYWAAVAGAKGTKLNWSATWRNYAADPRFPHPEGAAPGRKRVLAPSAAQQSPIPEPTGPASFIRESLAERGVTVPEVPIGDFSALFAVAEGRH